MRAVIRDNAAPGQRERVGRRRLAPDAPGTEMHSIVRHPLPPLHPRRRAEGAQEKSAEGAQHVPHPQTSSPRRRGIQASIRLRNLPMLETVMWMAGAADRASTTDNAQWFEGRLGSSRRCKAWLRQDAGTTARRFEGSLTHARAHIEAWRVDYNEERPHTSLEGLTPTEFATRSSKDHNQNRLYL